MGFLGSIGSFFSKAFDAVKSFATSGFGSTLISMAATALGGPLGGVIAKAATGLLSGGFNVKNLLKTGLDVFGGLAGGMGLGSTVTNLFSALKNPTGLLGSIGGLLTGQGGGLGDIVKGLLGSFAPKIQPILDKVSGFLGGANSVLGSGQGFLGSISNLLGQFGINTGGLTGFADKLSSVMNTLNNIQGIIGQIGDVLKGVSGMDAQPLRA